MPAVVWVHGGGWIQGDSTIGPDSVTGMIESALVTQGWTFASINYRLAPRYRWPAQIVDTKCAVRYLRQHAKGLAINPRRIGAVGASAGGHLVSLLGLAGPNAGFDVGQHLAQSSAVQAVVDMSGPADLTTADWTTSPVALSSAERTFGLPLGQLAPVLTKASPVTYIRSGAPPFLVLHGAADTLVPPDQATELVHRLQDAGDDANLVMLEHADHTLMSIPQDPADPTPSGLAQRATSFLAQYLGRA
jgi:acetyl esterase/lipase